MKITMQLSVLFILFFGLKTHAIQSINDDCFSSIEIQNDLSELYTKLKASHYDLFANVSSSEYDQWFDKTKSEIQNCMKPYEVELMFQKFMAFGKIAHAKIDLPTQLYSEYLDKGGKFFPLEIKSDGQKIWVSKNLSHEKAIQAGDQITSINGISTENLLPRLNHYLSTDTKKMFGGFLEFYMELLLWFEFGEMNEFSLKLIQNGQESQVNIDAINQKEREQMIKALTPSLSLGWNRMAHIEENNIAYLRPGPFYNTQGEADEVWDFRLFQSFIDESFQTFEKAQAKALLIDLRNNPGGNNSFSDLMVERIANQPFKFASTFKVKVSQAFKESNDARFDLLPSEQKNENSVTVQFKKAYANLSNGDVFKFPLPLNDPHKQPLKVPVYILVNRHSYSNAVTVAAMAQDYGFAKIIGEETTDLATTYGAMEHFKLTETGIKVSFPKAFIVRPSGDDTVRGVVPDYIIETPIFESEEDPVLKQALKIIQKKLR